MDVSSSLPSYNWGHVKVIRPDDHQPQLSAPKARIGFVPTPHFPAFRPAVASIWSILRRFVLDLSSFYNQANEKVDTYSINTGVVRVYPRYLRTIIPIHGIAVWINARSQNFKNLKFLPHFFIYFYLIFSKYLTILVIYI